MSFRVVVLLTLATGPLLAAEKAVERCHRAAEVIDEIMAKPEESIPLDLLKKAHCVVVVPGMKKMGLLFGAKYGKGLLLCRHSNPSGWTGPSTIRIEGGSVGLMFGSSATDLVMLVMNESGKAKLLQSKVTLGGQASVAAGPVGRTADAQTDVQLEAEMLAYSRAKGVFAGVSLDGSTLRPDSDDNEEIYGKKVTPEQVMNGDISCPESAQTLPAALAKYSAGER